MSLSVYGALEDRLSLLRVKHRAHPSPLHCESISHSFDATDWILEELTVVLSMRSLRCRFVPTI